MQSQKTIKIRRKFPDTHYFVYKDKQYPFKFNFFKLSSNYFITNEDELFQRKNIPLVEEEVGNYLNLDEETIHQFINYVQQQEIQLNNDNVISLHFLSEQFQIDDLATDTKEYIESHQQELALKILLFCQKNSLFKSEIYEEIISQNLLFYLKNSEMLELSVPKIYRIIDTSNQKSQEVNNFLLKCFEKFGKEASSLLAFCYLDKSNIDFFESMFYRFSNVLDFAFIDKTIFETMFVILKETKEKIKHMDEAIDEKEEEIYRIKNVQKEEILKEENKLKQIIQENENIKEEIKELQLQNKVQGKLLIEKENIIEQKQKEINELKLKLDQIAKHVELFQFMHKEGMEFDGIFNYLTAKTGGNIYENGTIDITSSSVFNNCINYMPQNLIDLNSIEKYFYAESDDIHFWVCFDFKNMEVEISSYTIKSNKWPTNIGHIKTWIIEISNDGSNWTQIDKRENDSSLNGRLKISSFDVQEKKFARFCRFHNTGNYWGGSGAGFNSIEFYGRLIIPKKQ